MVKTTECLDLMTYSSTSFVFVRNIFWRSYYLLRLLAPSFWKKKKSNIFK